IVGFFLAAGGGESTESVIEIGAAYITIAGPAYLFLGVFQIALGGFRGSGSTRLAMVFSTQELWLYRIPISYALLVWVGMGVTGVWYAVAISYVLSALTTCGWFLRGTWTEGVVERDSTVAPGD
ncbi:MAG: MATE family efflux transporter, partial [Halalkalicoccus sp.]|nr:MATE family efflux transporter [Halalkalicoccus sp.]